MGRNIPHKLAKLRLSFDKMSNVVHIKTKPGKIQTTLGYKQTKLNLSRQNNKQSDEIKNENQESELRQDSGERGFEQTELMKSKKEAAVQDVPAIVTSPEIRRVLGEEGVTKVVIDLETSSRGRLILISVTVHDNMGHKIHG